MKSLEKGQIWLVNFDPSFGHEYQKVRPAIIIQKMQFSDHPHITIIPISSQISKQSSFDVFMQKDSENRLVKDSLAKIRQVSSFDKRRFIKYIGVVNKDTMAKVEEHLRQFLGL